MDAQNWFEQLFGFRETSYAETRRNLALTGTTLRSLVNGRAFEAGVLSTPTLQELRAQSHTLQSHTLQSHTLQSGTTQSPPGRGGELMVTHEVVGDVLEIHAQPDNHGAMFQVASQFNCLEFADPQQLPEDGITGYAADPTQGPACALAAAAATVVRNYFVPVEGQCGQTSDRQINNLDALGALVGAQYWDVRNGYTWSDPSRLKLLLGALAQHEREAMLGAVKVGLQRGVQVTFASRFVEPHSPVFVSQVFCSALSCGYSGVSVELWEPLATLVLDATYEATLRAAVIEASEGTGSGRVWLTFIGGGVFANRPAWIAHAIGRALSVIAREGHRLDVRVAHHRQIDKQMKRAIDEARCGG